MQTTTPIRRSQDTRSAASCFKPKRSDIRQVQRCATECEINARAAAQLRMIGQPSSAYSETAARYSRTAFLLASVVATRPAKPLADALRARIAGGGK